MRRSIFFSAILVSVLAAVSVAQADDLLVQVRLDKSVTEVDSAGTLKPIRVGLYVQNLSDRVIQLKLSKQHICRLYRTFGLIPGNNFLPTVAEGTLTPTFGQFWNSVSLGAHAEMLIATGTLPDAFDLAKSAEKIVPGAYMLDVQQPEDPRFTLTGSFPGWSSAAITVVDATGGTQSPTQPPQATPETPWKTGSGGFELSDTRYEDGSGINANLGYQFIPRVNGKVTKLGALIKGTARVRLYDGNGAILAYADVTGAGDRAWSYAALSNPAAVSAGKTYTVAVRIVPEISGSTSSLYRQGKTFPQTYGNIQILQCVTKGFSELMPRFGIGVDHHMGGQADIEFVPDAR